MLSEQHHQTEGTMRPIRAARRIVAVSFAACAFAAIPSLAPIPTPAAPAYASSSVNLGSTAGPTAAVPKGFRATALSWTSPKRGWVLGTELCGPKYANCPGSQVIGTI